MVTTLEAAFNNAEAGRKAIMQSIKHLSAEKINHNLAGRWSIAQIISHLISAEQLSINYMNKKFPAINENGATGLMEELKMVAFIVSQRLPLKYKAPVKVLENTIQYTTYEELDKNWQATRISLRELLEKFSDQQLNKKILRHPALGMINIKQAVRFMIEHAGHHTPQIKNQMN